MNNLCTRVRGALNLLLLLSLLQAWVLLAQDQQSIADDVRALASDFDQLPSKQPPDSVRALLNSYQHSTPSGRGVRSIPLSILLAISDRDVAAAHPTAEEIDEVELSGATRNSAGIVIITGKSPEEYAHEGTAVITKVVSDNIARSVDRLNHLRSAIESAGLSPTATVYDLERSYVKRVEIPFVKQEVEANSAFWILALAELTVSAFLYVLMDSMWMVVSAMSAAPAADMEMQDCIPLYPSPWARALATAWILAPCILTASGRFSRFGVTFNLTEWLIIAALTIVIAVGSLMRMSMLRRRLLHGR